MSNIHLAQVGFFQPVFEAMRSSGANVDYLLNATHLNRFDLENFENYVPQFAVHQLFELIKQREGIEDFLSEFYENLDIVQLANWGNTLSHSSNLLSAVQFAQKYGHIVLTNERISLQIKGRKTKVSLLFLDPPSSDWSQFEYINFAYMYSTFKMATGTDIAPDEIHLQNCRAPDLDILLPSGNKTKIMLGQPTTSLVFPTEILSSPMLRPTPDDNSNNAFAKQPLNTSDLITTLFDSLQMENKVDLNLICDVLDVKPRTLQRRITEEGKTFKEIIDHWRFSKSIELLSDPNLTIKEISACLGYANVPNFDRAFRRWTQISPMKYRDSF